MSSAGLPRRTKRALDEDPDVLKVSDGNYLVEGNSEPWYHVDLMRMECSCPDHEQRGVVCKHMRIAAIKDARSEVTRV